MRTDGHMLMENSGNRGLAGFSIFARFTSVPFLGLCTLLIYALTWFFYQDSPHTLSRLARELFLWFGGLGLVGCYILGFRRVKASAQGALLPAFLGFGCLFALFAMYTFPFHSTDLYGYINRGWQQAHYGMNPYVSVVDDVFNWQADPMLTNHWVNNPCPYGFLFANAAKWLCMLGSGDPILTLFLFKGANVLAHGVTAWLIWAGCRRMNLARPDLALYLYVWNPLILMHQLANGHNDILMGCLATLGVYLVLVEAWAWVVPVLVAATLMKYAAGLMIPLALLYIGKNKGWKTAGVSCAYGLLTFALLGAGYLKDWEHFRFGQMGENATLTHNSLHAMVYHLYEWGTGVMAPALSATVDGVGSGLKMVLWGGFLAGYGGWLLHRIRQKAFTFETFVFAALFFQLMLVGVVSSKFYAWYIGMFFPMALFLRAGHWLRHLVIAVSCTQVLSLTFLGQAHIANYLVMMLVPAIGVAVFHWAKRIRGGRVEPAAVLQTAEERSHSLV